MPVPPITKSVSSITKLPDVLVTLLEFPAPVVSVHDVMVTAPPLLVRFVPPFAIVKAVAVALNIALVLLVIDDGLPSNLIADDAELVIVPEFVTKLPAPISSVDAVIVRLLPEVEFLI